MSGTVRKPLKTGVARMPVILQQEELECGAACLAMVLAYYGKWLPLARVREECAVGRNGTSMYDIVMAARQYGLDAKGRRLESEALKNKGTFPCIIHVNFGHFMVLKGFRGNKAYLNDPKIGSITMTLTEFNKLYTGASIILSPAETFQQEGKPVSMLTYVKQRLRGTGKVIAFAVVTGAVVSLVGVANPAFKRMFTDYLITNKAPEWFLPFIWILLLLAFIQICGSALSEIYNRRIGCKMEAVGSSDFIWKLLKMPASFFEQRRTGDLLARQQSNANITGVLINTLIPLLFQLLSMIFYFTVMIRYSWPLTGISVVCMAVATFSAGIAARRYRDLAHVCIREKSRMVSAETACISMIDTIKASGAEDGCFGIWAGMNANVNTANVKRERVSLISGSIPGFLSTFADMMVLALGTLIAMQGNITVGMIMAFQGFLLLFMQPSQTLVSVGQTMQEMRSEIERVDDVMNCREDKTFADEDKTGTLQKLSGRVEMKNITFGYSKQDKPVISDFSMSLEPGKRVALVGKSGCGKSTLGMLLIGMYQPWSGEILFDGKPMNRIPKNVFYASVAIVNQDTRLFEGTIQDNIKNMDEAVTDTDMVLSAMDAQIHDLIMSRPSGYHNRLNEGGRDLSGGQRQMIEIARALAIHPNLLILDEATSALDAETEYDVALSLRNLGIASVVIAHRLSTIRSCDEIIMLDKGCIIGRGTHDELMETCKEYRALVNAV